MANYPLPKFHFQVDWGLGDAEFDFTEVSGLDVETEVIEYRGGTNKDYTKSKQPGLRKYSDLTCKRGTFKGVNTLYEEWRKTFLFQEEGESWRRDITISLLGENHTPLVIWKAINAWPKKVQSTDLKADGNEIAIETMEICHEGLTIEFTAS